MKRVLGMVLAGLVGAGTLFSGVGVAHAEEEVLTEEVATEESAAEEAMTEEKEEAQTENSNENTEEATAEAVEDIVDTKEEITDVVTMPQIEEETEDESENVTVTQVDGDEEANNDADFEVQERVLDSIQPAILSSDSGYNDFLVFDGDKTPKPSSKNTNRYTVLCLDYSGSMAGVPIEKMRESAIKFCKDILAANGENYVSITSYSGEVYLSTNFTSNISYLEEAINTDITNTGTNIYSAVFDANNKFSTILENDKTVKNMVVLTDGVPYSGSSSNSGPFTIKDHDGIASSSFFGLFRTYIYQLGNGLVNYVKNNVWTQGINVYSLGFFHNAEGQDLSFGRALLNAIQNQKYYDVTDVELLEFTFGEAAQDIINPSSGYPIVVVPGIMGSNLYNNDGRVWAPSGSTLSKIDQIDGELRGRLNWGNPLETRNNGVNQNSLEKGQREYGADNNYEELVDRLCEAFPNREVYFFSYDWRQSNVDSAKELKNLIEQVTKSSSAKYGIEGKVDIVAHSMGGIVTSLYIAQNTDEKVNKTITCGTPYEGASGLLHRALTDTTLGDGISDFVLRTLGGLTQKMKRELPSITELAPNERLFNVTPWKHVTSEQFVESLRMVDDNNNNFEQILKQNATKMTYEEFGSYIDKNINKHYSEANSSKEGSIKNSIEKGNDILCNRNKSYFILGGGQKTIKSGTLLPESHNGIDMIIDLQYENKGDGTVPYLSGSMLKNLESLGTDSEGNSRFYMFNTTHGGAAGHESKNSQVANGANNALDAIISIINSQRYDASVVNGRKFLQIRIACPVEVSIEHNGETLSSVNNFDTSFGSIDLIGKAGEIKSVYLEDGVYRLNLNGTDSGTMDLALRWFDENNDQITEKEFLDIPVTASTLMYVDTFQDGTSELMVDTDGDGTIDDTWYSNVGDVGYRIREEEQKQEDQKQEEQKQEEQKQEAQPVATQKKASASTAQPVSVVKAAQVTSATTTASKTGDTNLTALWITLSAVSVGILGAIIIAIKKRRAE